MTGSKCSVPSSGSNGIDTDIVIILVAIAILVPCLISEVHTMVNEVVDEYAALPMNPLKLCTVMSYSEDVEDVVSL